MKLGALFSGGKDSNMALYWALEHGHTIEVLITLKAERADSYMFHIPNIDKVSYQAEAMDIPLIFETSSGIKEKELEDLERALEMAKNDYGIEGVTAGALASQYQKERVEKLCAKHSLQVFAPYWHHDPEEYMNKIISSGFDVIITGVAADGLDESWLARKIDKECITDLKKLHEKYKVHMAFEGGEAETYVLDCPLFNKRIKIEEAEKQWHGNSGELIIKKVSLVPKDY